MQPARPGAVGLRPHAEDSSLSLSEIRTELSLIGDRVRERLEQVPDILFDLRCQFDDLRDSTGLDVLAPSRGFADRHPALTAVALLFGVPTLAVALEMVERGGH
jgi:hypothetical protein